jgi:carbonic anhydrase
MNTKNSEKEDKLNMWKKLVYLFLAVFLSFSLEACSEKTKATHSAHEKEAHSTHTDQWSYEGETGPEHWGELDKVYFK